MKRRNLLSLLGSTPLLSSIQSTTPLQKLKQNYTTTNAEDKLVISKYTLFDEDKAIYDLSYQIPDSGKNTLNLYYKQSLEHQSYKFNKQTSNTYFVLQVFKYHETATPSEVVNYFETIADTKKPYTIYFG